MVSKINELSQSCAIIHCIAYASTSFAVFFMLKNTIYFSEQIFFNDTPIYISRKKIKNMYLRVRSPNADIHISAPKSMSIDCIKIFLTEKKHWIDAQKQKILLSNTEKLKCIPALCTEGAIHSLWGETYTL